MCKRQGRLLTFLVFLALGNRLRSSNTALLFTATIACIVLLSPLAASADCSDAELTAVFIVSDIYPLAPHLELLDVAPIGPVTNPSEAEMIAAIQAVQPENNWRFRVSCG